MPLFILRSAYPTADSFEVRRAFKDVFKKFNRMALRLFVSLLFSAWTLAQFEVRPDHFDAALPNIPQETQHPKTILKITAAKRPASGMGSSRKPLVKQ
jgi:hypothetical protein